ncbi:MAG: amidinotransferase [Flavobacteriales bacterium]|nr:amidinotransferase [Flavobacteriales bacterium]
MKRQSSYRLLMIRPRLFRKNEQTAVNNYYQSDASSEAIDVLAEKEYNGLMEVLTNHGIRVLSWNDDRDLDTPDRIFPNNWISFHEKAAVLYPMFAQNRRAERNLQVLTEIERQHAHSYDVFDLTAHEKDDQFLEGTGSLVLDRINHKAFAAISPRTNPDLVLKWCKRFDYKPILFEAFQTVNEHRLPIYHTNVMMSMGTDFVVICDQSIDDSDSRTRVMLEIERDDRTIIRISEEQVNHFCGNILEVENENGETFIVMSDRAYHHFDEVQKKKLREFGTILHAPLHHIEIHGGGSARCMLAEIF